MPERRLPAWLRSLPEETESFRVVGFVVANVLMAAAFGLPALLSEPQFIIKDTGVLVGGRVAPFGRL